MGKIKTILKLLFPPIFLKLIFHFRRPTIQFQKTNLSWDDALKQTASGYSAENILIKCRDSLLQVKNGTYPYERDSVLFTEKEIFFPLLASLFYVSLKHNSILNLIDFGGSLGSAYFQNKDFLKQAGININWNIVEQDNFVKCGKEYFSNGELHFYNFIDEIMTEGLSVCLFGSVLPYLKDPYTIFDAVMHRDITHIIIDRTMFAENETEDILSIQKVPPEIYDASYPAWFLSLSKFLDFIRNKYTVIFKWNTSDNIGLPGYKISTMGFFLEKIV